MRTTKLLVMSLVLVSSLALAGVGGTFATWSDSETSEGNTIQTGSVDLLVATCDANWQSPGTFKDDLPWGVGLDPCFNITSGAGNYTCYSLLWNAGCIDTMAHLNIKNVSDSNALSSRTTMNIWYDHDGNPNTSLVLVASDTIANLSCHNIELGGLPAGAVHQLKLDVEFSGGCPGDSLSFDIRFDLASDGFGFGDSEISENYLSVPG